MVVAAAVPSGDNMAAAATIYAAPQKVSTGSDGRVDFFSVGIGTEGRNDAPCSNHVRGDAASFSSRQSSAASVRTKCGSICSKRSKASESSLSIKTDYGNVSIYGNGGRSGGKVVITKPIETIQIQHSSRHIHNNHSFKKEHKSMSSTKRKQLQRRELEYWSGLSVRVAMSVMEANGSEKMAQKASNIVLDEGRRQRGKDLSSKLMRELSSKLSVALLEAGGDQQVGLAVVLAVMAYGHDEDNGVKSTESMLFDDSSTVWTESNARDNISSGSVAPSLASTILSLDSTSRSNRSNAFSAITPSIASKRRQLKSMEMQILEKQKFIEETERRNQEREREINERMAAFETAEINKRIIALDAKKAALVVEKASATQADRQDITADAKQDNNGEEKVSAFRGFMSSFWAIERIAALETTAKERAAALDVVKADVLEKTAARKNWLAKTDLLEKAGTIQADQRGGNGKQSNSVLDDFVLWWC